MGLRIASKLGISSSKLFVSAQTNIMGRQLTRSLAEICRNAPGFIHSLLTGLFSTSSSTSSSTPRFFFRSASVHHRWPSWGRPCAAFAPPSRRSGRRTSAAAAGRRPRRSAFGSCRWQWGLSGSSGESGGFSVRVTRHRKAKETERSFS